MSYEILYIKIPLNVSVVGSGGCVGVDTGFSVGIDGMTVVVVSSGLSVTIVSIFLHFCSPLCKSNSSSYPCGQPAHVHMLYPV